MAGGEEENASPFGWDGAAKSLRLPQRIHRSGAHADLFSIIAIGDSALGPTDAIVTRKCRGREADQVHYKRPSHRTETNTRPTNLIVIICHIPSYRSRMQVSNAPAIMTSIADFIL